LTSRFQDELGDDLARTMLDDWYFWGRGFRNGLKILAWFDNVRTTV
jgi:hypothetical protein